MIDCALVLADASLNAECSVCGEANIWNAGPRIARAATSEPICRGCGRKHCPQLLSLLDLAATADKVGRHARHLLTPPMKSLLELARAAETFAGSAPPRKLKAG